MLRPLVQHMISTTVSRSTPTHATSRIERTSTSTRPKGASIETMPSRPATEDVLPQRNPQPRTITFLPTLGEPSRARTTTRTDPFSETSRWSGVQSSNDFRSLDGASSNGVQSFIGSPSETRPHLSTSGHGLGMRREGRGPVSPNANNSKLIITGVASKRPGELQSQ